MTQNGQSPSSQTKDINLNRFKNGGNSTPSPPQQLPLSPVLLYCSPYYQQQSFSSSLQKRRNSFYKRKSEEDISCQSKTGKKRKKPLSQNIPQTRAWSLEDAKRALEIEREYNKRSKSHSLIIKFPDAEVNKEIVLKLNPAIEHVHFQQPSTPRFCFVSLKEDVNPEEVIKVLNETPFHGGFLTAEYKKDRDEEFNIDPEDIDPLTLYVGNLPQEVTKEHVLKIFPESKIVDIGFAKKIKHARYAFISFRSSKDSIEAFKANHGRLLNSKSLIVRFGRLHGTVAMPSESKMATPSRTDQDSTTSESSQYEHSDDPTIAPWDAVDVSKWIIKNDDSLLIKKESSDKDSAEEPSFYYIPDSLDKATSAHKPNIKEEILDDSTEDEIETDVDENDETQEPGNTILNRSVVDVISISDEEEASDEDHLFFQKLFQKLDKTNQGFKKN